MTEHTFTIVGDSRLHCESCEARVRAALQRLHGVRLVTADAGTQRVTVTLGPNGAGADEVRTRLRELGYDSRVEGQS